MPAYSGELFIHLFYLNCKKNFKVRLTFFKYVFQFSLTLSIIDNATPQSDLTSLLSMPALNPMQRLQ